MKRYFPLSAMPPNEDHPSPDELYDVDEIAVGHDELQLAKKQISDYNTNPITQAQVKEECRRLLPSR